MIKKLILAFLSAGLGLVLSTMVAFAGGNTAYVDDWNFDQPTLIENGRAVRVFCPTNIDEMVAHSNYWKTPTSPGEWKEFVEGPYKGFSFTAADGKPRRFAVPFGVFQTSSTDFTTSNVDSPGTTPEFVAGAFRCISPRLMKLTKPGGTIAAQVQQTQAAPIATVAQSGTVMITTCPRSAFDAGKAIGLSDDNANRFAPFWKSYAKGIGWAFAGITAGVKFAFPVPNGFQVDWSGGVGPDENAKAGTTVSDYNFTLWCTG